MKRNVALAVAAVALLVAAPLSGQNTLLRTEGSLSEPDELLDTGGPVAWHTISVEERSRVVVRAASVDFEPALVLDLQGRRVWEEDGLEGGVSGAVFVEAGGTLRVGVSTRTERDARPPLEYSLRIEAGAAPALLQPGETRGGELTDGDERLSDGRPVDWFPIRLEVGERVRFEVQSVEFDAFLIVRTPGGGRLENDDLDTTDAGLVYTAVEQGTVQVGATAFSPGEWGAYMVSVARLPGPRAIEMGSTVSGTLGDDGTYTDSYLLSGKRGSMVLLRLESEDFDTVLRVRASGGFYAENDDAGTDTTDSELFYAFERDAAISIQAGAFSFDEGGSYQLSALRFQTETEYPEHREGRRLEAGSQLRAVLRRSAPERDGRYYHEYTIAAEAGRLVRVTLSSGLFDPFLEVATPSGEELSDDDSGDGNDAFVEFEAPESGIYRVRATTYGTGGLGAYTVRYEESDPREVVREFGGRLGPDSPVDEAGRPVARHELEAQAGQSAVIEVQSGDFDTMLIVRGPEGETVAENDDFGSGWNSRVEIEFPQTGVYTLIVTSFWDDQRGSYNVKVSR